MAGCELLYGLVNFSCGFWRRFCIKNALIFGHGINIHGFTAPRDVYNKCISLVQPVDWLTRNIPGREYIWRRSLDSATEWRSRVTATHGCFKDMVVVFEWLPAWPTCPGFSTRLNSPRLRNSERNSHSLFKRNRANWEKDPVHVWSTFYKRCELITLKYQCFEGIYHAECTTCSTWRIRNAIVSISNHFWRGECSRG